MKIKISLIITVFTCFFSLQALANDAKEKIYLIQMSNQLNALKPLIIAANKEQENDVRVRFHYMSYRDSNGNVHNGLFEDITEIQHGIQDKLNQSISEPHYFKTIKGDYLDFKNVKSSSVGSTLEDHHVKR
jgi:RAQPRD family integrative conjugative element protein